MAEVTDVDIVAGLPTTGTGTVPTLSKTNTVIGAVAETAPASDTASSGLNGRLQRIAQRLTTLITNLAPAAWTFGSGAIAAGTPRIALATDSPGVIQNLTAAALTAATAPAGGLATLAQYNATNPAPTDTQTVALQLGPNGQLLVLPYGNPANFVSGAITTAMTGTTSTSLIAAPGAGLRNYLTQITVSNSHATVGTDVAIQDGSGGTTYYTIPAAAVYGGAAITLPTPLKQPTTNTAVFCVNVTTGASVKVSASGYKGA